MELFDPKKLKFNFAKYFKLTGILSLALTILSLVALIKPGLNYGIDFRGGVEAQVAFKDPSIDASVLRQLLDPKFSNLSIVNFSEAGKQEFLITAQSDSKEETSRILTSTLEEKYGKIGEAWSLSKMDSVGPKVGSDLRKAALLSLLYTCILITLYMYWRFDFRYSPGALACIFHDLIMTAGFLVLVRAEFSTTLVAALLTLAGYSINDTVVVFDRIRELEPKYVGRDKKLLLNEAINSTLSRTIMTAGMTLMSCVVLYFLGGPTLRDFAMALFFGIIVGTYSSAFVAAPTYLALDAWFARKEARGSSSTARA